MAYEETVGKILFTEEQIRERAKEIATQIARDYQGEEVILLCSLKGGTGINKLFRIDWFRFNIVLPSELPDKKVTESEALIRAAI